MAKITPLRRAVRYIDAVAVPDALKELQPFMPKDAEPLGLPRFSLSKWVSKQIAKKKNA